MEMDSSSRSRSFDRSSRDSAILKKPRLLAEEPAILRGDNNKPNGSGPLVQRQPPGGFRQAAERDRDSKSGGIGGGGYQPQSLTQTQIQQQQHQELVSQYRTALAELTFNSKPIITNLTIIAGENLHAARAIAATICSNILEVPSDQKLPSLYLLDSIVKNIGRDYIKHFAARLPEVFCKAYRQVDSAIHPGMRHLFGTWKGVFPPQTLQMIEKELGFQPAANGSSAGLTTSASESQSQRPGRSIHVNPKYLEARQRLQQSGRAKGATNNMMTNLVNSPEDTERVDITAANITSGRQLADPRLKMHQAQRDIESDSIHDSSSAGCGDLDYGSDMLGPSEASFGKSNERVAEQGSWYGPGSNSAETISMQRNGFDMKHGPPNYSAPRSSIADAKVQPMNNLVSKRVSEVNRSWKNSEEEEYMWDDMNSRLAIPGASSSSKRDPRLHFESERSGFENHPQKSKAAQDLASRLDRETSSDSLSTEQKDQAACRQMPLLKSQGLSLTDGVGPLRSGRNVLDHAECFPTSFGRLSTTVNSLSRTSLQSQMVSNHIGTQSFGFPSNTVTAQQRHAVGAVTPSAQVPVHQRPPSPSFSQYQPSKSPNNIAEQDWPAAHLLPHADAKAARSRGQIHTVLPSQSPQASFQTMPQNSHLGSHQKLQPHNLQKPSSQLPLSHTIHAPFLQTLQPESISESGQAPELPPQIYVAAKQLVNSSLDHSKSLVADIPVSSSTSNLLAAVSSIFGNKSIAGGIAESTFESEPSLRPHPPNGSPLTQLTSSHSRVVSPFTSPYSQESTSFSASISQRKVDKPPLPPGPPPSTSGTTSTQTSSVVNAVLNPVSSLLSTLVAKGIISASKSDSPSSSASTRKSESPKKDSPTARAASPILGSSLLSTSSTDEDFSLGKAATKHTVTVPQSAKVDMESLIGFEFKPDVIRESHPAVISKLIDDLPHQCSICGLRFKLQEGFDRHKEWHKLRNSESHTPNKALRRWYANSDDWLNGKPNLQLSNDTTDLMDSTEELLEIDGEQMIAADESQCVCILCGNLFEDFYSLERDKWMFKGATYLSKTDGEVGYISSCAIRGPIVHANCISESSIFDLDLFNDVEVEKDI